jgi:hypothetical protein
VNYDWGVDLVRWLLISTGFEAANDPVTWNAGDKLIWSIKCWDTNFYCCANVSLGSASVCVYYCVASSAMAGAFYVSRALRPFTLKCTCRYAVCSPAINALCFVRFGIVETLGEGVSLRGHVGSLWRAWCAASRCYFVFCSCLSMELGKLVWKDTHSSLRSIKYVVDMDVPRYILMSRYIHICDMFYGTGKVCWIGRRTKTEWRFCAENP